MPYIITNGSSYCQKTKTQAVVVVTELTAATQFKTREDAEKLLQRATRKLRGYEIQDVSGQDSVPAEKSVKPRRTRARKAAVQEETVNVPAQEEKTPEKAVSGENRKPQEKTKSQSRTKTQKKADPKNRQKTQKALEAQEEMVLQAEENASAENVPAESEAADAKHADVSKKTRNRRNRRNAKQENVKAEVIAAEQAAVQENPVPAAEAIMSDAGNVTEIQDEVSAAKTEQTLTEETVAETEQTLTEETVAETEQTLTEETVAKTEQTLAEESVEKAEQLLTEAVGDDSETVLQEEAQLESVEETEQKTEEKSVLDDIQAASAILWAEDVNTVRKETPKPQMGAARIQNAKTDIEDAFAALWGEVVLKETASQKQTRNAQPEAVTIQEEQPETEAAVIQEEQPEAKAVTSQKEQPEAEAVTSQEEQLEAETAVVQEEQPEAEAAANREEQPEAEAAVVQEEQPEAEAYVFQEEQPKPEGIVSQKMQQNAEVTAAQDLTQEEPVVTAPVPAAEKDNREERHSRRSRRRSNNARRNQYHDQEASAADNSKERQNKQTPAVKVNPAAEKTNAVNTSPLPAAPAAGPVQQPVQAGNGIGGQRRGPMNRRPRKEKVMDEQELLTKRRIFTTQERNAVYNRTEGHCGICGCFIPLEEYTIDHIIPLSKGGTNALDNLQACCGFCNKAKDDSMGDEFFNRIERIFMYQAKLKYGKKQIKKLKKVLKDIEED